MIYRKLGLTGLEVSEIGFGAWGIGGTANGAMSYGPTDDQESRNALDRAFDLGVTYFDTSDLYGYGHSERLLGQVFRAKREKVVIGSKVGFLGKNGDQDFSAKHIRNSIEKSLQRLGTDYLDLYQLHDPPIELLATNDEIIPTLESLQAAGKIRTYGISVRHSEDALTAVKEFGFPVVQVNLNLVDQRIVENGFLGLCGKESIGLIARTPLCFGFLTGSYTPTSQFDPLDHRNRWPRSQIGIWSEAIQLFLNKGNVTGDFGTFAQRALRYCLSYPSVSTTIPGMLSVKEVEENVEASSLGPLSTEERIEIEKVYKKKSFFLGKAAMGPNA